jgi:hypothetical protein
MIYRQKVVEECSVRIHTDNEGNVCVWAGDVEDASDFQFVEIVCDGCDAQWTDLAHFTREVIRSKENA